MSEFLDARWQHILFRSYQHTSLVVQAIILATVIALALAVLVTNAGPWHRWPTPCPRSV